jgi:peptidoglycan/xylan/chitin deacetylase (PgdA/CDA1 family)
MMSSGLGLLQASLVSADTISQNTAKISFTFDDGLESAYTDAAPTLAKYGLTGTDYIITNCVGLAAPARNGDNGCAADGTKAYMTWDQIKQLQASGWEMGSHTVDHGCMASDATIDPDDCANAVPLTKAQLETELAGSQQALTAQGISATDLAWPYGDYSNLSLSVAAKYYATTRGFADDDANNVYPYNDLVLHDQQFQAGAPTRTWALCSDMTVAGAKSCIDNAVAAGQWVVLVFHNIAATPVTTADSYDESTSDLDAIAAYAAAKQQAGQAKVVNVNTGTASGANMMPNGDFANGIADGWTTNDPTDVTADAGNNGRHPEPTHSVLLKGNTSGTDNSLFSPQVAVTAGQSYVFKNYVNILNGGSINFYIDEYDASGTKLAGQDPSAGLAYIDCAVTTHCTDVADVNFNYTPSAGAAYASLQVIVKGAATQAYYDGAQLFVPGSTTVTPPADTTAPVASAVTATGLSATGATISWTTDEPSTSQVNYGATTAYGSSTVLDSTLATTHTTALTGLTAGMTYHYQVVSTDAAGNTVTSGDYTFATPDVTPPVISNVMVTGISDSSATVSWTTDEPSTSGVGYGTMTPYGSTTTTDTSLVTTHSATLTGLTGNTTYHYQITSADAAANSTSSLDATFTTGTTPDTTAPVISNVASSSITQTTATLTWLTDEPSTSQIAYGSSTTYDKSSVVTTVLSASHSVVLTGLTAGMTYHYQVVSTDAAGNITQSTDYTFTTSAAGIAIPGDINKDGFVNDNDATVMFANWGPIPGGVTTAAGDFDHNGVINDDDATTLFANWSK